MLTTAVWICSVLHSMVLSTKYKQTSPGGRVWERLSQGHQSFSGNLQVQWAESL